METVNKNCKKSEMKFKYSKKMFWLVKIYFQKFLYTILLSIDNYPMNFNYHARYFFYYVLIRLIRICLIRFDQNNGYAEFYVLIGQLFSNRLGLIEPDCRVILKILNTDLSNQSKHMVHVSFVCMSNNLCNI